MPIRDGSITFFIWVSLCILIFSIGKAIRIEAFLEIEWRNFFVFIEGFCFGYLNFILIPWIKIKRKK